eukprot:428713_1
MRTRTTVESNETTHSEAELIPLRINIEQTNVDDINKERINCLVSGYIYIYVCPVQTQNDIIGIICNFYKQPIATGQFLTYDQYFGEGSVHIDAISCIDHQNEWPKYLYITRKKGIQQEATCIILMILIEIGSIIALYYLLIDKLIFVFIMVLFFSLTSLILCVQQFYKFIQGLINPAFANYSLLKFDINNNVIHEFRMKICKIKYYGNLILDKSEYFCQLVDVIKLAYIDRIGLITMNRPYKKKEHRSGFQGSSYEHISYHDGYLQINKIMKVRLPYGVDCDIIKNSIEHILGNQTFIWSEIDHNWPK